MKKADAYIMGFTRYGDGSWWYDDADRAATESEERLLDEVATLRRNLHAEQSRKTITAIRNPSTEAP